MEFPMYYAPNNRDAILFFRRYYDLISREVLLHGHLSMETVRAHQPTPHVETQTFSYTFLRELC